MAEPFPLSLRASPKIDANKESLTFLISRINEQRLSFRNVTEESLEAEIRIAEAGQLDIVEEDVEKDNQDVRSRQEQLDEARNEMLSQVQYAAIFLS